MKHNLKKAVSRALTIARCDSFFRFVNRKGLLVVVYHGITRNDYTPAAWTQLPVAVFRSQLEFLARHYHFVSLSDLVAAVRKERVLPERAALLTFDDGFKNNFSVAFPLLRKFGVPAAIFLAVDLIGTDRFFWFDELYLLMCQTDSGTILPLPDDSARHLLRMGRTWEAYCMMVERMKRTGREPRDCLMETLRRVVAPDRIKYREDFGLLDWDEVREMHRSGIVEFGVHTATHRVLSELDENEWEREIIEPKRKIEEELGVEISTFCFPNGRPGVDFSSRQVEYLRRAGYVCSFLSVDGPYRLGSGDPLVIGRVPAGNDYLSNPDIFRLTTSGAMRFFRKAMGRPMVQSEIGGCINVLSGP